jgi:succinate dehydrogenase / fumarate reductase flavoprotein subunit
VTVEGNRHFNPGWHLALDLGSMLTVSECITRAALEREESRGGHTRSDYPGPDPRFGSVNVVVRLRDGEISVSREPLPQMPDDLRSLFDEPVKAAAAGAGTAGEPSNERAGRPAKAVQEPAS